VIDTEEWRLSQITRLDAFAAEIRGEHGPLDDEELAARKSNWDKQLEAVEAKFGKAEPSE
jgi:hypothetical protein